MKPILFNTHDVRAILDDRKTVTRRVVKPQPSDSSAYFLKFLKDGKARFAWEKSTALCDRTPPYQPGDILYVRETFGLYHQEPLFYVYRADSKPGDEFDRDDEWKWRPSIHMPKEAARIFLRVAGVRVERLHGIKNEDVLKEGITPKWMPKGCKCTWAVDGCLEKPCANRDAYEEMCHTQPFAELWDSTIKPADLALYGWVANPWVWVIEFERISKEEAMK